MRILVVEDEPLLAMLLEEGLAELGHEVVGCAATVDQAMVTLDGIELDFALLDFTLADDATSAPVAIRLRDDGIPFVYLTGHRSLPLGGDVPVAPLLTKPFTLDQLDGALRASGLPPEATGSHRRTTRPVNTLIDISQVLRPSLAGWPGEPAFALSACARITADCPVNTAALTLSTHAGTHADAPLHYDSSGADSAGSRLDAYVGRCVVLDVRGCGARVEPQHVAWDSIGTASRVLFRTYARFPHQAWDDAFTAIAAETIERLGTMEVVLVGTDAASLDPQESKTMDAHHAVRRHGMRILEGLVLDDVAPGEYELIALPLRIAGADASPVRAVLRTLG